MTNSRHTSTSLTFAYLLSALVTISTVVVLRFIVAPHAQAIREWSPVESQKARPSTLSVQAEIRASHVGWFGRPLDLPYAVSFVNSRVQEIDIGKRSVEADWEVDWSHLLPSLQLVDARLSSLPTIQDLGLMRVGITNELKTIQLSSNKLTDIKNEDGQLLVTVPHKEVVTVSIDADAYSVTTSTGTYSAQTVKFVPRNGGLVTIENYENRPDWNIDLNDNRFRGRILISRGSDNSTWVVNALRLGAYVRGVAEASNSSPVEYQKALAIAARTYAVYNMLHPTKHAGQPYVLDNTENDQVYRGYNLEQRADIWASSARSTSRQVLVYEDEVIIAPYFSQSDGRTRAWSEVWSGDYPWAVSVDDPGCEGLELKGHGVGMSGKGGVYFADLGYTFNQILTHYYSGVVLQTLQLAN